MLHPTAIVHPSAELGKAVDVGPYCIVGEHVSIGARTVLQAHVVVNGWTKIGEDCRLYPFSTVGAASQDRKYAGERAFTRIGNRTILREYVSIQRATGYDEATSVGDDCLLLAYVHIAHNCELGDGVTMSNLAQLAGHVQVADYVTIGGHTGVHQFTRIGRHAMVGGMSKCTKDVPPFFLVEGNPCQPYGLNSVGLRRAAFTPQERAEIKKFYKLLYNPKLNVSQAIDAMQAEVATDPGREIIAFLEAPSERGVLK